MKRWLRLSSIGALITLSSLSVGTIPSHGALSCDFTEVTVHRDFSGTIITIDHPVITCDAAPASITLHASCATPGITFTRVVYLSGPAAILSSGATLNPGQVVVDAFSHNDRVLTFTFPGEYVFQGQGLFGPAATPKNFVVRVGLQFAINATSFIPADHVIGPPWARCPSDRRQQLFFAGDSRINPDGTPVFSPTAASFRTRQQVTVLVPDGIKPSTLQNLVGVTRSYAPDALADGKIDAADDDGVLNDCHLQDGRATASSGGMFITVQTIDQHRVTVRLFGGAANPLVPGAAAIDWDFSLTIDTSGSRPRWTLIGKHDGFPAFEIYINNTAIYTHDPGPPPYSFLVHLRRLLPPLDQNVHKSGVL